MLVVWIVVWPLAWLIKQDEWVHVLAFAVVWWAVLVVAEAVKKMRAARDTSVGHLDGNRTWTA